jgi:hypothetical protein
MNRAPLLKVFLASCMALALQSCDFLGSRDFVGEGLSQTQLRALFQNRCKVPLTQNEEVRNAFSDGGRDQSYWFQVSFDPQRGDVLRERLLESGFLVSSEHEHFLEVVHIPKAIGGWWDSAAVAEAALFTLQRPRVTEGRRADVFCFLDEKRGTLFAFSYPD